MADLVRLENLRKGKIFRVWDILIFAVLIALIVCMLLYIFLQDVGENVEVYVSGRLVEVIPLNEDSTTLITSEDGEYSLVVCVDNGEAFVIDTTCKDKICQNSFHIRRVHSQIICAPAKIVVKVVGESDYDGIIVGG